MKKLFFLMFVILETQCITLPLAKKPWTVLIYIAGDNDLEIFIDSNMQGMEKIGTNENCNIIACVARCEGNKRTKKIKYILVERNKQTVLYEKNLGRLTDSGETDTLIDFCNYSIKNFPADHYGLVFWNHGTGSIDPTRSSYSRVSDTFYFNSRPPSHSLQVLPLLHLKEHFKDPYKAVCFDDTTGNFLTEKKIHTALSTLLDSCLQGKKFAFIGFDACLMAMTEIASLLKTYAHFMIGSQEIEPGAGWNYEKVFSIFAKKIPTPQEVGIHIVREYKKYYSFSNDLTLSCIDLNKYELAEENFSKLVAHLLTLDLHHHSYHLKSLIKTSAHKKNCTHFDEPEYIDIIHFLENLLYNFKKATIKEVDNAYATQQLELLINTTIISLEDAIVANTAGKYFKRATGLSIYFPHYSINKLYKKNIFCCATQWAQLLHTCF